MDNQQQTLRELALFAGAGGGILGGKLLGWETICAVEYNAYARSVLLARQNDGTLSPFPIWDDVRTFDGKPWRGLVDVVSGGFPCQDISAAGKGAGIDGERSGLWSEFARIIGEVRPIYAFIENSPMLVTRGLDRVLCDLAAMGYDAEWGVVSAADCGAPHKRERIWIVGHTNNNGQVATKISGSSTSRGDDCAAWSQQTGEFTRPSQQHEELAYSTSKRQQRSRESLNASDISARGKREASDAKYVRIKREWPIEPGMGRVVDGMANRSDRLTSIGNGQVPRVAATAWNILTSRL